MFRTQVVGIRKGQTCKAAEREHIPDALQPFVRHRFVYQRFQIGLCQVVLILVVFRLHLIVLKRVFLDPLVAERVQHKVFQAAQEIDRAVVLAVVRRLHKGIQPVDIGVIHGGKRQVVLL